MERKFRLLKEDEISVKVSQVHEKGVVGLLYKTARTDMDLLDEVVGPENWTASYRDVKGVLFCTVSIRSGEDWVSKEDCGIESRDDGYGNEKKGEASDAFKRACVRWGIGRELYSAPFIFMDLPRKSETRNNKTTWKLVDRNLKLYVDTIEYDDTGHIVKLIIVEGNGAKVFSFPRNAKPKTTLPPAPDDPYVDNPRAMLLSKINCQKRWGEEQVNAACMRKYGRNLLQLSNNELAEVLMLVGGEPCD